MIKKSILIFAIYLLFPGFIFASNAYRKNCTETQPKRFFVEGKVGYFWPTDTLFREIYSPGAMYTLEFDYRAYRGLHAWVSGNYYTQSGRTLGVRTKTRIHLVPIGLGLSYYFTIHRYIDYIYLGAGILPSYLAISHDSPFLVSVSDWGFGGDFKGGFIFKLYRDLFLDIYIDYKLLPMDFSGEFDSFVIRTDADLSGLTAGAGLGYRF